MSPVPIVSILAIFVILKTFHGLPRAHRTHKTVAFTVRCVGVVLWPLVIRWVCPECDETLPGVVWLFLYALLDGCVLLDDSSKEGLKLEKSSVLGILFGLASMAGNRPDAEHSHLFVYCVLGLFLAVFPSHDLDPSRTSAMIIDSVQRVLLNYCIALFVTAIALTRSKTRCTPS